MPRHSLSYSQPKRIGVFLPNWVGDALMCTPALRALRRAHPQAEIIAIGRPPLDQLLVELPSIDRFVRHHPKGSSTSDRGWTWLSQLRELALDWAILFPNSLHTAALAWLGGARRRIGSDRDGRRWLLTDPVRLSARRTPHPVLLDYLEIVAAVGCPAAGRELDLMLTQGERDRWQQFRVAHPHWPAEQGFVAFNTGGAFGPAKNWPIESFVELGRRIVVQHGRPLLVVCGPAERTQAADIVTAINHPLATSLASEAPSIGLTKAALAAATAVVTTDSGPRHIAAAFQVPTVTLYGPTHQAWSQNFFPGDTPLQLQLDCGPCQQRACPLGHHRCMRELSVDQVERALRPLLGDPAIEQPARRVA